MKNIWNKVQAGMTAFMAMLLVPAAAHADTINDTISTAQTNVTGYATQVLSAVVALALFGAGVRIAPRVIRILASKAAG